MRNFDLIDAFTLLLKPLQAVRNGENAATRDQYVRGRCNGLMDPLHVPLFASPGA